LLGSSLSDGASAQGLKQIMGGHRVELLAVLRLWEQVAIAIHRGLRAGVAGVGLGTRLAFGRNVWPHLFRHCAVTGLVDMAPEDIAIAPDLLGHASLQTTQQYYILARGTRAHQPVQKTLSDARHEARRRLAKKNG
jgi:integrase